MAAKCATSRAATTRYPTAGSDGIQKGEQWPIRFHVEGYFS
jgi:hypothetical protein